MKRIQLPSFSKRIAAFAIDLVIFIGLTCFFYFICFKPTVSSVQHFDALYENIKEEQLKSNLYTKDGDNIITITSKDKDITPRNLLDNHVKKFYVDYMSSKDTKYTEYYYQTHILFLDDYLGTYKDETITKPDVIVYKWNGDHSNYIRNDGISDADEIKFAKSICFSNSITLLNNTNPIKGINGTITWAKARAVLYSSILGSIIPCLIIPLILKNGKTIGKLCLHLIVLTDEGYYYKKYKLIFRYLALYFVEIFGGVVTILLTLLLSSSMVLFSRKKRALHDYIAFSVVADEKYTVFFKDEIEEEKYKKLEASKK